MLGNLPLLVIEATVGIVTLQALAITIDVLTICTVGTVVENATNPAGSLSLEDVIVLYGIGDTHTSFLDINLDDGRDAHHITVESTCMISDTIDRRGDDDAACILIIERDSLLVLKGSRSPVVQRHIKLCLRLTRGLDNLLIRQRLVLIQRQFLGQVSSSIEPLITIFLFSIFLQIGRFHHLCLSTHSTTSKDSGQHPAKNLLHIHQVF